MALTDGYKLEQTQTVQTTLSRQMLQSVRLLSLTSLDLAAELRRELQQNPVIEEVRDPREATLSAVAPADGGGKSAADGDVPLDFTPDGAAAERILGARDAHLDYFLGNLESYDGDEEQSSRRQLLFDRQTSGETLQEHLLAQIPVANLAAADVPLAEVLVANVSDTGQFTGSYPDIQMTTGATVERLERVRRRLLAFDPAGCCWRDPKECLLAQLDALDDSPYQDDVREIITHHLASVAAGRTAPLCAALDCTPAQLTEILKALRSLNPFPGRDRRFVSEAERAQYVHAEVHAVREDGRWVAHVDARDVPDIRISPRYLRMLQDPNTSEDARAYLRGRIQAAEGLIEAVENRSETIRRIAQAIVDAQGDFFARGFSALRPLTQSAIAARVGLDESTVSRTVREKYMTTPFGTVLLRRFFTAGIVTASGETVSNKTVQDRLRALVDGEDKAHPLSDEALVKELTEAGFPVARRTVAKYRTLLKIPKASERRVLL